MIRNEYIQNTIDYHKKRKKGVSAIVLHYISALYSNPQDPFRTQDSIAILKKFKLSYHYLIARDGLVTQLVPESQQAYHAGRGNLYGEDHPNGYSIGIALIASYRSGFTAPQMEELITFTKKLRKEYRIPLNRIVGHEHVSWNRKTPKRDPGKKFDWYNYLDRSTIVDVS